MMIRALTHPLSCFVFLFVSHAVSGRTVTVDVGERDTIRAVRAKLREKSVPHEYVTTSRGRRVSDDATAAETVGRDGTLIARARLIGGHCQVPCGIFDDPATVASLREMSATVRKAMTQIQELSKEAAGDALKINQMTRWVMTKEEHCDKIISTIASYCLCQRVKAEVFANDTEYVQALKAHHAVMQWAMKCKQNIDTDFCCHMDHALDDMSKMYLPH